MPIDGIHSAMTPLQFARARSASRSVETTGSATTNANSRPFPRTLITNAPNSLPLAPERLVAPPSFHWSYRPIHVNGKRGAKPVPQLADSDYWSSTLNRVG